MKFQIKIGRGTWWTANVNVLSNIILGYSKTFGQTVAAKAVKVHQCRCRHQYPILSSKEFHHWATGTTGHVSTDLTLTLLSGVYYVRHRVKLQWHMQPQNFGAAYCIGRGVLSPKSYVDVPAGPRKYQYQFFCQISHPSVYHFRKKSTQFG